MSFGHLLRLWRKNAGVTQPVEAKALGMSERTWKLCSSSSTDSCRVRPILRIATGHRELQRGHGRVVAVGYGSGANLLRWALCDHAARDQFEDWDMYVAAYVKIKSFAQTTWEQPDPMLNWSN